MKDRKPNRKIVGSSGVRAKKYLGQHFLTDPEIAKKIAGSLDFSMVKNVVEVGPGTGILTGFLLENPISLIAMEVDLESIDYLKKAEGLNFKEGDLEIRRGDFLKEDLNSVFKDEGFAVVGNFPYNISSQILFKALEHRERVPNFCGMFQKEVAQRICSGPGSKAYGILSVLTQAFYQAEYLFTVPPSVFNPPPKVDSGVLRLTRKENFHLECDEKLFFKIVKMGFQQRRKTLRNSLKRLDLSDGLRELWPASRTIGRGRIY